MGVMREKPDRDSEVQESGDKASKRSSAIVNADAKGSLAASFRHAFEGIFTCIRHERNMKIHCCMAILVVFGGTVLRISLREWIECLILFGLVMSLEMVNTAVESVVDLVTDEYRPLAKKAKDVAAGAVLISAIMAAIIGCIIFVPKIIGFFM